MADDAMPERTTLLTVAEVEACRAELVDSGYPPVEIINHDADHRDAGKAPSRAAWYAECVRTGIAEEVPTGVGWEERDKRQKPFRKYLAELKAAGLIGVNGENVNDLRKGQL